MVMHGRPTLNGGLGHRHEGRIHDISMSMTSAIVLSYHIMLFKESNRWQQKKKYSLLREELGDASGFHLILMFEKLSERILHIGQDVSLSCRNTEETTLSYLHTIVYLVPI